MSAERKQWFGRKAIEWVLDEVPNVPPNLVSTLVGLARHAQDDGTGAGPGVETLMGYTRKSKRQVKYDLDKLRELNLIKVSKDQSRVAHIRADRRPVVYELAMATTCNPLHPEGPRGATDCTSPESPTDQRGAMERSTGCNTASDEVQPIAPEENYEKNLEKNNPSLSGDLPSVPAPCDPGEEDRERDGSTSSSNPNLTVQQQLVIKHGCPEHLAQLVVEYIEATNAIDGLGWWITADRNGTLAMQVQAGIAANTPTAGGTAEQCPTNCPLHSRFPLTDCGVCWADVQGGGDPFKGREDERPAGWWAIYNQQARTSERGQVAPRVNMPEGTHTAQWNRRRQQHGSAATRKYQQAQDLAAELDAEYGNQRPGGPTTDPTRILDHDAEATR